MQTKINPAALSGPPDYAGCGAPAGGTLREAVASMMIAARRNVTECYNRQVVANCINAAY